MTYDLKTRLTQWWIIHGRQAGLIAAVCAVCLATGLFALNPQERIGYERATVVDFGVREGSKRPGVRLWVETAGGALILIDSRSYNPALRKGAEVCVLKTRGRLRAGTFYQLALPSRCGQG